MLVAKDQHLRERWRSRNNEKLSWPHHQSTCLTKNGKLLQTFAGSLHISSEAINGHSMSLLLNLDAT